MIIQNENESRPAYLMRVAAAYINECPDNCIDYDDAQCDGYCLAEELEVASESMADEGVR